MYREHCGAHRMQMVRYGKILNAVPVRRHADPWIKFKENFSVDEATDCWVWDGPTNSVGRPRIHVGNKFINAARYAMVKFGKALPRHLQANHTCNNGLCVNPAHLYAGTQKQNMDDMIRQGRAAWQTQKS